MKVFIESTAEFLERMLQQDIQDNPPADEPKYTLNDSDAIIFYAGYQHGKRNEAERILKLVSDFCVKGGV